MHNLCKLCTTLTENIEFWFTLETEAETETEVRNSIQAL